MSNFTIDQNKLVNTNTFNIKPLAKTDYGLETKIYKSRYKYSRNIISNDTVYQTYDDTSLISYNDTKSIRLTLTPKAIRLDQFNYYNNTFNFGYPENYVYTFCNPELASVFQYGSYQYSKKFITNNSHPNNIPIETVYSSIQSNQYGKNFTGNTICCPSGFAPDPITGLCSTIAECVPQPEVPCPEPEYVNLKNTIYGYAYYLNRIRYINVPNIGERLVRCAGGHICSRTHFRPKLTLADSTVILPSNNISMDNFELPTPQYNPVAFDANDSSERSDSFTFTVPDPSLLNSNCLVELECVNDFCHNGVTMLFLVGQRSDNDEYVLLFADCVAPGEFNSKFLGTIPCNDYEPPVPCEPTTPTPPTPPTPPPPPDCNYDTKTQAAVTFENITIPFEAVGDQDLLDQLLLLAYQTHVIPLASVDEFGFSSDPYLAGTILGTIQVLVYINGVVDGPDTIQVNAALNIIQTASAYPFIYGINITNTVNKNNLCSFNQTDGIIPTGGGTSAPFYTGNGTESVSVEFI